MERLLGVGIEPKLSEITAGWETKSTDLPVFTLDNTDEKIFENVNLAKVLNALSCMVIL
jgi:hypothetical protein